MQKLIIKTKGKTDIIDITEEIQEIIDQKNFNQGAVHLFF